MSRDAGSRGLGQRRGQSRRKTRRWLTGVGRRTAGRSIGIICRAPGCAARSRPGRPRACNGDGQLETSRPGAPRIQVKHAVGGRDLRPVRVARHHHAEPGGDWIDLQLMQVMQHVDPPAGDLDGSVHRVGSRPAGGIGVPPDGRRGRNLLQPGHDLRTPDIAGVDDVLGIREPLQRLRPQQAVRVRDDPDLHRVGTGRNPLGGCGESFVIDCPR